VNSTQIFVASEDNVKFEVSGVSGVQQTNDPLASAQPTQQQTQQQQQKPCKFKGIKYFKVSSLRT
jgi:hypothetical protein